MRSNHLYFLTIPLCSILFPILGMAQAPGPPPTSLLSGSMSPLFQPNTGSWNSQQIETMCRLRDAAISDDYAMKELRHLTDNIGPRISGSPQAQAAVEYVSQQMRELGADVQLEKVKVPHWVRGIETAELMNWPGATPGTVQKIVVTALGGSPSTGADGMRAQVVVANSFDDVNRMRADGSAKGKILLLNHPFQKRLAAQGLGDEAYGEAVLYRVAAPTAAALVGAKAVLVRSVGGADYRLPHTGFTRYTPESAKIPAGAITTEDAELITRLSGEGTVELHLTLTPQSFPEADSANVIADWKGSEKPDEIVIVSGHLDSWDLGTGAIDDGAGVVVAMEAIQALRKLGIHPKRTIRFVAWMDEESGASGGQAYAREHASELAKHSGAIESDLGAGHPAGIQFANKADLSTWLGPVARVLEPIGSGVLEKVADAGTDISFSGEQGVPGFAPAQDGRFYFNYHHTSADTLDKVDQRELNENAAVMTVLAYALADAAELAPR